jgi:hypothetical protein
VNHLEVTHQEIVSEDAQGLHADAEKRQNNMPGGKRQSEATI